MTVVINGTTGIDKVQTTATAGQVIELNGIKFPATQSASTDANTLDDYEEGTFTPTLDTSGVSPSVTYVTRAGTYVKIGRLVTLYVKLQWSAYSGGSGSVFVKGLPFSVANASDECGGSVGLSVNWNNVPSMVQADSDTSWVFVMRNTGNSNSQASDINSTGYLYFTISYLN